MENVIVPIMLGIIISILGIFNMNGHIASVHWYHRQRITEVTRKPFGRLIGLGTLMIGASLSAFGIFTLAAEKTGQKIFTFIGTGILITAVIAGLALSFFAMIKYNKGIF